MHSHWAYADLKIYVVAGSLVGIAGYLAGIENLAVESWMDSVESLAGIENLTVVAESLVAVEIVGGLMDAENMIDCAGSLCLVVGSLEVEY